MPLSEAQPRTLLHLRDITLRGYERADGLFDVEAELADTKAYPFPTEERGVLEPGERLHGMKMRMTVDENFRVVACEAVTEHGPYGVCGAGAANFSRIAGLTIGRGFLKEALALVGGVAGCTHLRELLQPLATVAFQTIGSVRTQRRAERLGIPAGPPEGLSGGRRGLVNTCLAYAEDGPVVRRRWPDLYTGDQSIPDAPAAR